MKIMNDKTASCIILIESWWYDFFYFTLDIIIMNCYITCTLHHSKGCRQAKRLQCYKKGPVLLCDKGPHLFKKVSAYYFNVSIARNRILVMPSIGVHATLNIFNELN